MNKKTKGAKSAVMRPEYQSKVVKSGKGKGSYRREYPPTQKAVQQYLDFMDEMSEYEEDIDKHE